MAWTEITRPHYERRCARYARWGIRLEPHPWTAVDGRRKVLRFERWYTWSCFATATSIGKEAQHEALYGP